MQEKSERLFEASKITVPGGVNSPVRAWGAVGGSPRFIESASGARIRDVDGNEYIDFLGSWGPMILGHAAAPVVNALAEAAAKGTSYGASTPGEVLLAQAIVEALPSIEQVRLVSSGTEAAMAAIRLARGATGRDAIIKMSGCYHGHSDGLLVKAGSGAATLGVPDSGGVPAAFANLTRVAEMNDLASVRAHFTAAPDEIAAVIVEPIAGNMGVVPPAEGFLEGLRALTTEFGALLIFDEVITGFRVGRSGAQGRFGVTPDLTVLGKVIGGGLPVGAFGGPKRLMELIAPLGPVYQGGTLSGNPLAVAAGLATLAALDAQAYDRLEQLGARLQIGVERAFERHSTRAVIQRVASMWTIFFGVDRVTNWTEADRLDRDAFRKYFGAMTDRGFFLPPSPFEASFLSLAHDEDDVDAYLAALEAHLAG